MSRPVLRSGLLAACGFLAAPALFAGCREILSFEERELDASLADAGSDAPEPLSCEAYCALLTEVCKGGNTQFDSPEACLGLCSTFPVGALDDENVHSLGCRIHLLETSKAMIETSECAAAGPGGNGLCGSNCESYCTSTIAVCPGAFTSVSDCLETCTPLIECGPYTLPAVTPDDPSIQCRLYHLSVAASNFLDFTGGDLTPSQTKHCPHAIGDTECIDVADPMCP